MTDDSQDRNSTHTGSADLPPDGQEVGGSQRPKKAPISFGTPAAPPSNQPAWNVLPTAAEAKPAVESPPVAATPIPPASKTTPPPKPATPPPTPKRTEKQQVKRPTENSPPSPSRTVDSPAESRQTDAKKQGKPKEPTAPQQQKPKSSPPAVAGPAASKPATPRTASPQGGPKKSAASKSRPGTDRSPTEAPVPPRPEKSVAKADRSAGADSARQEGRSKDAEPRRARQQVARPEEPPSAKSPEGSSDLKSVSVCNAGGKQRLAGLTAPKRQEPEVIGPQVKTKDGPADPAAEVTGVAVRFAPPWLVSMVIHFALVILLVLLTWNIPSPNELVVTATYAEKLGEQLDQEIMILETDDFLPDEVTNVSSVDLPELDDVPLPATLTDLALEGSNTARIAEEDTLGADLTARGDARTKRTLLEAYGGNATTEQAVAEALEWLKRNQQRDGSWSLVGPYNNGAAVENHVAATAMALLAFQGAGHTDREGKHAAVVAKGWKFLLGELDGDGNFIQVGLESQQRLYSQAQATIALCELYAMTGDPELESRAQSAIDYAVRIQSPEGGWRYIPGEDADTSVTGWFVMALQSARMGGLNVPEETFQNIERFLDSVAPDGDGDFLTGSRYQYRPSRSQPAIPSMTAEALLCRQYMGWERDDPRLEAGMEYLLRKPITWNRPDVYYWYYATQVAHHMEGDYWRKWNQTMRQVIPENQVQSGREKGSWDPRNDENGNRAGRLFMTCMCVYMLEVYYRHLPLYSKDQILGTR